MKARARWALAITATCVVAACGDQMIADPQVPASTAAALSASPAGDVVRMLKRTDRLDEDLTTTAVIGPRGGHLQIARAGVRVEFAPGAVTAPTRISMTAIAGRNVAYRFAPHGLVFKAPVTLRQSLRHTTAWNNRELAASLQGSYFDRLLVDETQSYARSLERRAANLLGDGRTLEFSIEHFSGYMVSTGEGRVDVKVEIEISR